MQSEFKTRRALTLFHYLQVAGGSDCVPQDKQTEPEEKTQSRSTHSPGNELILSLPSEQQPNLNCYIICHEVYSFLFFFQFNIGGLKQIKSLGLACINVKEHLCCILSTCFVWGRAMFNNSQWSIFVSVLMTALTTGFMCLSSCGCPQPQSTPHSWMGFLLDVWGEIWTHKWAD